jgi:outer membrane receptor for ferrienterochelin and colicins
MGLVLSASWSALVPLQAQAPFQAPAKSAQAEAAPELFAAAGEQGLASTLAATPRSSGDADAHPVVELELSHASGVPAAAEGVPDAWIDCRSMSGSSRAAGLSDGRGVWRGSIALPAICTVQHMSYETAVDTIRQNGTSLTLQPKAHTLQPLQVLGKAAASPNFVATKSVTVVEAQQWERRSAPSVDEALRHALGVNLAVDPILGSQAGIDGLGASRVLVTIDGIPLTGRMGGGIDLGRLDPDRFERIEVARGPMAVRYGSSAVGGVINLVSRQPDTTAQWGLHANGGYSSDGWYTSSASADWSQEGHSFRIGASRDQFVGWNPEGVTSRNLLWNPKLRYGWDAMYSSSGKPLTMQLRYAGFDETIDNRGAARAPWYTTAFDDIYQTQQHDGALRLEYTTESAFSGEAQIGGGYLRRYKNTFFEDLSNLTSTLVETEGAQDTTLAGNGFARLAGHWTNSEGTWHVELGASGEYESLSGRRIEGGRAEAAEWGPYTETTWKPHGRVTVVGGLRYAQHSDFGREWMPALNLRYGSRHGVWRAEYGRGFRTPSLKERFFEFIDVNHFIIGNADLQAERSHFAALRYNHDLGGRSRVRSRSRWTLEASASHTWLENGIQLIALNATQFSYGNVERLRQAALSTGLSVNGSMGNDRAWSLTLDQRWIGLDAFHDGDYRWQVQVGLGGTLDLPWALELSAQARVQGAMQQWLEIDEEEPTLQTVPAFTWLDAGLGRRFWGERLRVDLGARNLLNITNLNATLAGPAGGSIHGPGTSLPIAAGRALYVRLALDLHGQRQTQVPPVF